MTISEVEDTLPWGFHDAYLERLQVDWLRSVLSLEMRLMTTESQDMDRRGKLSVSGLIYFTVQPPEVDLNAISTEKGLWIDSGVEDSPPQFLPKSPPGCFLHYLYLNNWNCYMYICGKDASFDWTEAEAQPARSTTRALLPGQTIPDPV